MQRKVRDDLVEFIKISFQNAGFERAVIAISGGVDSSTSAALAVEALGANTIYPLLLPYGNLGAIRDAQLVARALAIPQRNIHTIDIQPFVDPIISLDRTMDQIRRGNIMARVRMIVTFDNAKKRNALVIGTENKTEHLLGYFTRFGDEASDVEPLRNLYKTQIYELARFLGVPEKIINKTPSAGLWQGQTDEGEFGFSYKEADEVLSLYVDQKKSIEEIVDKGFSRNIIEKVIKRMKDNDFKHHLPILP
ncbi:NAD+ synthase [Candidatus Gottesmanbacteria bacterium]|nr:NAD+ synthase [Candidatus Gottesmanbacteria bacterium]